MRRRHHGLSAAALAALLLVLVACSRAEDAPDPHEQQRQRLTQLALSLGIPAGYPGPQNTGVPLGATLTPSGSVTATQDGGVIENLDIDGCISIKASDVTVRNVRVRCANKQRAIVIEGPRTGIVVEDSEIDGAGTTQVAIGWSGYTLRRVNVHDVIDGPRLGRGVTVEDSWIHDMVRKKGFHSDALQATGGDHIVVRHNTLVPIDTSEGDDPLNSAVQLGAENDGGVLDDVVIEDNYLDGGSYSVNVRDDPELSGVVLRGNVFGSRARYGPIIAPAGKVTVEPSNSVKASGAQVKVVEP